MKTRYKLTEEMAVTISNFFTVISWFIMLWVTHDSPWCFFILLGIQPAVIPPHSKNDD